MSIQKSTSKAYLTKRVTFVSEDNAELDLPVGTKIERILRDPKGNRFGITHFNRRYYARPKTKTLHTVTFC